MHLLSSYCSYLKIGSSNALKPWPKAIVHLIDIIMYLTSSPFLANKKSRNTQQFGWVWMVILDFSCVNLQDWSADHLVIFWHTEPYSDWFPVAIFIVYCQPECILIPLSSISPFLSEIPKKNMTWNLLFLSHWQDFHVLRQKTAANHLDTTVCANDPEKPASLWNMRRFKRTANFDDSLPLKFRKLGGED